MHISIADDLKRRFHAACALQGLKMSPVVAELIEQWLKTNEAPSCAELKSQSDYQVG
jgi:antitoxin component of RelBE/YafQ-DinJ toxin-antitoxin module